MLVLREDDGEDGVRAGRRLVHVGGRHRPAPGGRLVQNGGCPKRPKMFHKTESILRFFFATLFLTLGVSLVT